MTDHLGQFGDAARALASGDAARRRRERASRLRKWNAQLSTMRLEMDEFFGETGGGYPEKVEMLVYLAWVESGRALKEAQS